MNIDVETLIDALFDELNDLFIEEVRVTSAFNHSPVQTLAAKADCVLKVAQMISREREILAGLIELDPENADEYAEGVRDTGATCAYLFAQHRALRLIDRVMKS